MTSLPEAAGLAIDRALAILGQHFGGERTYKTDRDYATDTDYAIEDELRRLLAQLTPEIGFLGEERGRTGSHEQYWCLDPIDGTTNYSRGLPAYGISLALIRDDAPVLGEIALPAHMERYAVGDHGASLNGTPIRAAETPSLSEAVVAIGDFATGEESAEKNDQRLCTLAELVNEVGRVRMNGSVAADLAWLAAGRLDAVIVHSNKPWDMAAGVAIALASGAVVTHHDGSPYSLGGPNLFAAAPNVHNPLLRLINAWTGRR